MSASPSRSTAYELLSDQIDGSLPDFFAAAALVAEVTGKAIAELIRDAGMAKIRQSVQYKVDGSPVSDADRAAHVALTKALGQLSSFLVVSEEDPGGPISPIVALRESFFWLADPLDGTRDFLSGESSFAVALALMHSDELGVRPIFGAINDPLNQTTWWGADQSFMRKCGSRIELLTPQAPAAAGAGSLRVLGSRSAPSDRLQALYQHWGVDSVTRLGSALKFALIAEGQFDVYPRLGPTSEWDTAAGQALLEAMGGGLYAIATGRPLSYGKTGWRNSGFMAAANTSLLDQWVPVAREQVTQTPLS